MTNITTEQKQKMEKVFKKYGVEFAYIFGSFTTGNAAKASDIDIAVYLKTSPVRLSLHPERRAGREQAGREINQRFEIRLKLITELSKIFPKTIDLVVINDLKSVFFKYVILKEGQLIYNADTELRVDTECKILNEYFDFKPFLQMYNQNFINKKAYA